jgi:lysophospholipase L1-like esterase
MLSQPLKLVVLLFLWACFVSAAPHLITEPNSSRAVALESPSFKTQPFRLVPSVPLSGGITTRVMLFAEGIEGANASSLLVVARDGNGALYSPTVECVADLPGAPGMRSLVFPLDSSMSEGDLTVGLYFSSEPSNAVLIAVGHQGADGALSKSYEILCDGNSLTAGDGTTVTEHSYPGQLYRFLTTLGVHALVQNLGVNSQTTLDMLANAHAQIDPLFNRNFNENVIVAWEGTNHLYFGATGTQAYQALVSYCSGRRAAGFKVLILTVLPRANPGVPVTFEMDRNSVNTALRNNWQQFADGLVDVAADPRLQNPTNETYYSVDHVHLNDSGYQIVAQRVGTAVLHLGS